MARLLILAGLARRPRELAFFPAALSLIPLSQTEISSAAVFQNHFIFRYTLSREARRRPRAIKRVPEKERILPCSIPMS